jgi:hypothetical protein
VKLADAILLGSTILKPVPGVILNGDATEGCALGMAYRAIGKTSFWIVQDDFLPEWQWALHKRSVAPCGCPARAYGSTKVVWLITHVFNEHVMGDETMSLEQLVDWVRSLEPESANLPTANPETQYQGDIITAMEGLVLSVLKAVMTL